MGSENLFWACGAAFIASFILTRLMVSINIPDIPNNRSSHQKTTPTSGGVAVAISFIAAYFLYELLSGSRSFLSPILPLIIGGLLMMLAGLWDDIKTLSWKSRLTFQALAAIYATTYGLGFVFIDLPFIGSIPLGVWGPILTTLGIVAFINLFNFMDGLNGMASGCTLIALFFFLIITKAFNASLSFTLAALLTSSLIPLFWLNFPSGRLFMGDSGSQFLGLILPLLGVIACQETNHADMLSMEGSDAIQRITSGLIPFLFFTFIVDGLITIVRRAKAGKKIWLADRNHVFHSLLDNGLSPCKVAFVHFVLFVMQGTLALFLVSFYPPRFFVVGFIPLLLIHIAYIYLSANKRKTSPDA